MILTYIFYAFLAYMLYRLVFGFIIPLVRTTRRVKQSFRQMQEQMNAHYQQQSGHPYGNGQQQPAAAAVNPRKDDEDYIEFEEVK